MRKNISLLLFITLCLQVFAQGPAVLKRINYTGTQAEYPSGIIVNNDESTTVLMTANSNDGDFSGCNKGNSLADNVWLFKQKSNGTLAWKQCYGGSDVDQGRSFQLTADNGYIFVGNTYSTDFDVSGHHGSGNADVWVVKTGSDGIIQWQKSLGGTADDFGNSIILTSDGGYLVAGSTYSFDGDISGHHGAPGNADVWLIKLNSTGSMEWQKCFGGTSSDVGFCVLQSSDNGYVFAAISSSNDEDVSGNHGGFGDIWVAKTDQSGNLLWQRSNGGSLQESITAGNNLVELPDGSLIIGGITNSKDGDVSGFHSNINFGTRDAWIFKLSANGTFLKQICLGGIGYETCNSLVYVSPEIVMAGSTSSDDGDVKGSNGSEDFWMVKLSQDLVIKGQHCLGGTENDVAYAVAKYSNGNLVVAGASNSANGDFLNTTNPTNPDPRLLLLSAQPVATLYTESVDKSTYCLEDSIKISYSEAGNFGVNNKFIALMFGNDPLVYDTLGIMPSSVSGVIEGIIPEQTKSLNDLNQYIKVVSTHPKTEGNIYFQTLDVHCQPPSKPKVAALTSSAVDLEWSDLDCAALYSTRYKIEGTANNSYVYQNTINASISITGLFPSTTYVFSVATICDPDGAIQSAFTKNAKFTTPPFKPGMMNGERISVYPNPTTGFLNIKLASDYLGENVNIIISDMLGKVWYEEEISDCQTSNVLIQVPKEIANGMYALFVKTKKLEMIQSFLLQR